MRRKWKEVFRFLKSFVYEIFIFFFIRSIIEESRMNMKDNYFSQDGIYIYINISSN